MRACSTCREPIHFDAKKCTKCGSFQDLRRHLAISSTALALLIALISVASTATLTMRSVFEVPRSNLGIKLIRAEGMDVYFLVTNSGNERGAIISGGLEVHPDAGDITLQSGTRDPIFAEPGESRVINIRYTVTHDDMKKISVGIPKYWEGHADPDISLPIRVGVAVIEFDGKEREPRFYLDLFCESECRLATVEYLPEYVWSDTSDDVCLAAGEPYCNG